MSHPFELRELTVQPRRRGYRHRPVIVVVDTTGMTEDGQAVTDLADYARTSPPHIWVTVDPAHLLTIMMERWADTDTFNYQITTSREPDQEVDISYSKLTRFGFKRKAGHRNQGMHTVWNPYDMSRDPTGLDLTNTHLDLMRFGQDVRNWCQDNDVPIPTTLAGIAASLLRDKRFWAEARGRVPRATNENVRPYLPGVYSELRADTGARYQAVALDQRTAYHRAAQDTPTPNPSDLFARGYFNEPATAPVWCIPGDGLYERIRNQPGLVCALVSASPLRKNTTRPPAIQPGGHLRIYLWTNELDLAQDTGLQVHGLIAAWTSTTADPGLPRYGAWAQSEIEASTEYRRQWLKPTLHATYGLLAARPRDLSMGYYRGRGKATTRILGLAHPFPVQETNLGTHAPVTTNTAMLGTLQAEIRARSMRMANALMSEGVEVLHIHADGIHARGALPLMTDAWKADPMDNLEYLDRVSWLSDQGDTLPGRDQRMRVELYRHRAQVLANGRKRGRIPWLTNRIHVMERTKDGSWR